MIECLVLYHADLDGMSSAAIVDYFEPRECKMYKMNYGYDVPWNLIRKAKRVYMVDFALQPFSDMIKILEMKNHDFIWIDHHKTAIADYESTGRKIHGLREVGKAGCELTWDYFTKNETMEIPYPKIITLLGRYDVWDLELGDILFHVQSGMTLFDTEPENQHLWERLLDNDEDLIQDILDRGKTCFDYQAKRNETLCKSHSFDLSWEGYRFICSNVMGVNSRFFDVKFNHNDYDAMLTFGYTNKNWTVSMYTDKPGIDVGGLAKKYGGGGHVGAAGFQCSELPFKLEMK